jgi:hypothetical protein
MNRREFFKGLFAVGISTALPTRLISRTFEQEYLAAHLMRTELWSKQIKRILLDELNSMCYTQVRDDWEA